MPQNNSPRHTATHSPPWLDILDRPIAFHRVFVTITSSLQAGLMLSQAFYWARRTDDPDGWFYKTQQEWQEETSLSRWDQETAREKLRKTGFWHEARRGLPAKLFYRIDMEAFGIRLLQYAAASQSSMLPNDRLERESTACQTVSLQHAITEITAETTAENNPLPSVEAPPTRLPGMLIPLPKKKPPLPSRSHLVPDDFTVTEAMRAWAQQYVPTVDIAKHTARFCDHEFDKGHTDWVKAWRNWMRRAADDYAPRMTQAAPTFEQRQQALAAWAAQGD